MPMFGHCGDVEVYSRDSEVLLLFVLVWRNVAPLEGEEESFLCVYVQLDSCVLQRKKHSCLCKPSRPHNHFSAVV